MLGWQIAIQPLIQRAPVAVAVRIAPGSPLVLRRAAESELAAERFDSAAALSRDAVRRSPFDVRALRVVGLTEARAGRLNAANEILTLAGNWSLRDDPTHAWLVDYRLRRGDYASSFAHADTLVRRRADLEPQVFKLFTTAAAADPRRVLPVMTGLLAADPPWRSTYLTGLYATNEGLQTAASLAIMLQTSAKPMTTAELQELYLQLLEKGQIEALRAVRTQINRPAAGRLVTNGGFDDPDAPHPFQWALVQRAGAITEVVPDDLDPSNPALRVEYDGYSVVNIAEQLTFLPPGQYRFQVSWRQESGEGADRMAWAITCESGGPSRFPPPVAAPAADSRAWTQAVAEFSIPQGCPSQRLVLRGHPKAYRSPSVMWFDKIVILRTTAS